MGEPTSEGGKKVEIMKKSQTDHPSALNSVLTW